MNIWIKLMNLIFFFDWNLQIFLSDLM